LEQGRRDIDGLSEGMSNSYQGVAYHVHHLQETSFHRWEDPDHSALAVDLQLRNENTGFAQSFAKKLLERQRTNPNVVIDPGRVMGYYNADDLPVYVYLAAEYAVCDQWYCSVRGSTWPNRLYAVAGRAARSRNNAHPPIYKLPAFVRQLDERAVGWRAP
jgi:phospholipase C